VEHRSGATSEEADLAGGRQCPGEGGQCGGQRGAYARTFEDEEGATTKKRRRGALGGVAHRGDRFGGGTVTTRVSSDGRGAPTMLL
jgi:hypothetical protein